MTAFLPIPASDARLVAELQAAGLPTADLANHNAEFYALGQVEPVAFGGLIGWGQVGLLRSLVVTQAARGTGQGRALLDRLVGRARSRGIRDLWLLTDSAETFFAANGFTRRLRDDAPVQVRQTEQFAALCPASAALMHRAI